MSYFNSAKAGLATVAVIGFSAIMGASALAADGEFTITKTTNPVIQSAVKAYKQGDYDKSARLSRAALKASLSPRRTAIAQSNLCAAYAKLEKFEKAGEACQAALELRPGYAPAEANQAALTVRLASLK